MPKNKDISNKEVIDRLVEYFLSQDPKIIARSLANAIVDFNRIRCIDNLPEPEKENLIWRIDQNSQALQKFVKKGPDGDLKLFNIPSEK